MNVRDRMPDVGGVLLFFGGVVCCVSPIKSVETNE